MKISEEIKWNMNAMYVAESRGSLVNYEVGFYECPDCGKRIYREDFENDFFDTICPYCGFNDNY